MNWDIIQDYMNALLGALLLLIPLIIEARKSKKKSKGYMAFLVISVAGLVLLGFNKINRDNFEKDKNEKRRISDSTNFAEFKHILESKFNIKDSANIPIKSNTYNTYIKKADKVVIGGE